MSNRINFDIDVDVSNRDEILATLTHIVAGIQREHTIDKHNTGVYFQPIPANPFNNRANIDHKKAEELGYLKVDFLNVHIYEQFETEKEIEDMMCDPDWELLQHDEIVSQLFHISEYGWLMKNLKPDSVERLAMCLAIIRPSKRYLENKSWTEIEKEIWHKPENGLYYYKKAHAVSYAMAIVVQLNKLVSTLFD